MCAHQACQGQDDIYEWHLTHTNDQLSWLSKIKFPGYIQFLKHGFSAK